VILQNRKRPLETSSGRPGLKIIETEMPRSPGIDDLTCSLPMLESKSTGSIKEQRGCCQPDTNFDARIDPDDSV
jgi:hypothetical protein